MRLEQVFDNLLANAIKYSPLGGDIHISVYQETVDRQGWAVVSVRDDGIGIPAGDLPKLFTWFHRAANVGGIPGSGLGLAGARAIVEQHGGAISVASSEGSGSTFTVRLPLG